MGLQSSTDLTHERMFQQDGARAHTSKAAIVWLNANIKHYIPPEVWPPNSPDISLSLRFGALWQQLFLLTLSRTHCKH